MAGGCLIGRCAKLVFKTRDFREPLVPPSFEVANNQSIFRIDSVILSVGASRFIARLFQRQLDSLQALRACALTICDCLQCGVVEPQRSNQRQYLG